MLIEGAGNERPRFAEVDFAVFREEGCEGGLFGEGAGLVVAGREFINLAGSQLGDYSGVGNEPVLLTFHLSISSVSQGFSLSWVEGILDAAVVIDARSEYCN